MLRHDDPWWDAHYPPNGWGCKCYVEALDDDGLRRAGKDGPDEAPTDRMVTRTVGRGRARRTVTVPEGIDPGFDYAPGASLQSGDAVRQAILSSIETAPSIAAAAIRPMLERSSVLRALGENWRRWRRSEPGPDLQNRFEVGALSPKTVAALTERGDAPVTVAVTVDRRALGHMTRDPRRARGQALDDADLDRLPEILAEPRAVLLDTEGKSPVLLYVFDGERSGKIVVRVNYVAAEGQTNAIRTAGYVHEESLRGRQQVLLEGEMDE